MRIVVNDIAASKTGALSILRDFHKYIVNNDAGENEWIFVLGSRLLEERDNIRVIVRDDVKSSRKNRLLFDLKTGAAFFESLKPDVLFSMQNTLPGGYRGRQVLYVHQPLGYQDWKDFSLFKPEEREYAVYQKLIGRMIDSSVKRADRIIVQTEWMRRAVAAKTGVPADRIVKIMPDIDVPGAAYRDNADISDGLVISERSGHIQNYDTGINVSDDQAESGRKKNNKFFYPAGEILYKNHGCILEAVEILKNKGISDLTVSFTLNKGDLPYLSKYRDHEQVKYLGRISRDDVFARYKKEILLFPSYIETFGYPPAEARAVGGCILASDCPFCHEVLEGYKGAAYFDPFKPEELATLMERAIRGELFDAGTYEDNAVRRDPAHSSWAKVREVLLNG